MLTITVMLLFFDTAMALLLFMWPAPDTYLVPGVERFGTASVNWGATPPVLMEKDLHPAPIEQPAKIDLPVPPPPSPAELDDETAPSAPSPAPTEKPAVPAEKTP